MQLGDVSEICVYVGSVCKVIINVTINIQSSTKQFEIVEKCKG